MDQVVFFWRGNNLNVPEYLVKSIRNIHKDSIKIIQLSDKETFTVPGVDMHIKEDLPNDIMTARLKAYSLIDSENTKNFFCDADSLLINPLSLKNFEKGIYLMKRSNNFIINHTTPEYYPEFENKYICSIMPFLFGAIVLSKTEDLSSNPKPIRE